MAAPAARRRVAADEVVEEPQKRNADDVRDGGAGARPEHLLVGDLGEESERAEGKKGDDGDRYSSRERHLLAAVVLACVALLTQPADERGSHHRRDEKTYR